MNVQKEASKDAKEFARAQMFYGEGAGTRRKLIQATVDGKISRDPRYAQAFKHALAKQDMAEHVTRARWERERRDATHAIKKNVRAIVTGNHRGANTTIIVLGVTAYYAHQYGIDKKIYVGAKRKWQEFRDRNKTEDPSPHPTPTSTSHHNVTHIR